MTYKNSQQKEHQDIFLPKRITKKSDVFSLGIVLAEIFNGKRFQKDQKLEELCTWLKESNFSVGWISLIGEMVQKCVSKRPTIEHCFTKLQDITSHDLETLRTQAKTKYDWSTFISV